MSLAQHVTATEGIDREPIEVDVNVDENNENEEHEDDDETSKTIWRRLSYDAFAAPVDNICLLDQEPVPHIAAYKTSDARRFLQVAVAVIACCLASGIVFGFASLKPVLVAEGVYAELCVDSNKLDSNDDNSSLSTALLPCAEQDLRLNLFFIVASITANVSSLLAGAILDRFGRRVCFVASSVFIAAGCILMGYAFAIPEFDGYLVGNFFLGLGGTFLFVPSFQLANAFPKHAGLIVALITGAFDASAAVFLFYRLAWDASAGNFTPARFFFGFLIVPLLILVAEFTIMPPQGYHTTPELEHKIEKAQDITRDVHDSDSDISSDGELYRVRSHRAERRQAKLAQIESLVGDPVEREERAQQVEEQRVASGIWGVLHGLPAHRQVLTPWFVLMLALTVLQMLRMNYFIATLRSQYRFMLGSELGAQDINNFFDVALPIGGIATTPFIGILLNNFSVASILAVLAVFIAAIAVLNCLPFLWAGYATVVVFVLFRPLYYSAMSDYATKVFGFATFGRVYGSLICLSGLVQFVQSGLDALTHGPLNGDPTAINVVIGVLSTLVAVGLTTYVFVKSRNYMEQQQQQSLIVDQGTMEERIGLIREEEPMDTYGT